MTTSLILSSGNLLFFISFIPLTEVLILFEAFSSFSFCLTFFVYSYDLSGTATTAKLEGMIQCMGVPFVDFVRVVVLFGWLEMWLASDGVGHTVLGLPAVMAGADTAVGSPLRGFLLGQLKPI